MKKWLSRRMRDGDVATLPDGTKVKVRKKNGSFEVLFNIEKEDRIHFEKAVDLNKRSR